MILTTFGLNKSKSLDQSTFAAMNEKVHFVDTLDFLIQVPKKKKLNNRINEESQLFTISKNMNTKKEKSY